MSERSAPYMVGPSPIALMQCPIAGFEYHGGQACFGRIRIEDPLELHREPGNRHDPRAITVKWEGVMLGYVPREANYALSQMMDRGAHAEGVVKSLRASGDPWQRVMMEVRVHAHARACPKRPEQVRLWQSRQLAAPALKLARATAGLTAAQRETGVAVLRELLPEIVHQLARPGVGAADKGIRRLPLWDAVVIEIGVDGMKLTARYLGGSGAHGPSITVDLRRPLSKEGWIACFIPAIAAACRRRGPAAADIGEPLQRWIADSLQLTFAGAVDFEAMRKAALDFLAPDPLARSLANRIFAAPPSAEAFNWVCSRVSALALCAIEHPAMLPFLRLVQGDNAMNLAPDPLATLRERLLAEGMQPAAWKKLARWGFGSYERLGEAWWKPILFARFANLLHHLDVQAPPPPDFVLYAVHAARYRAGTNSWPDFERHPPWFMRAMLRELERMADRATLKRSDLDNCLDWLIDARPDPDPNQQRAGWPWILEQAQCYRKACELALAAPWAVPRARLAWDTYRVVAIDCAAALTAEAIAMKNCLFTYEEACRSGKIAVYSIRERAKGESVACFAAKRVGDGSSWELIQVAGKMNVPVKDELERIAHAMVTELNGGRGGKVAPF